jgi:hypothetical protein
VGTCIREGKEVFAEPSSPEHGFKLLCCSETLNRTPHTILPLGDCAYQSQLNLISMLWKTKHLTQLLPQSSNPSPMVTHVPIRPRTANLFQFKILSLNDTTIPLFPLVRNREIGGTAPRPRILNTLGRELKRNAMTPPILDPRGSIKTSIKTPGAQNRLNPSPKSPFKVTRMTHQVNPLRPRLHLKTSTETSRKASRVFRGVKKSTWRRWYIPIYRLSI